WGAPTQTCRLGGSLVRADSEGVQQQHRRKSSNGSGVGAPLASPGVLRALLGGGPEPWARGEGLCQPIPATGGSEAPHPTAILIWTRAGLLIGSERPLLEQHSGQFPVRHALRLPA